MGARRHRARNDILRVDTPVGKLKLVVGGGWVHVIPASWPKADILLSTYVGFQRIADIT